MSRQLLPGCKSKGVDRYCALYTHHLRDLLEQKRVPNVALFEAFYNYCFVPKHTIGTQLLTVRRDKREREAFAATQEGGEIDDEEDDNEGGYRVSLGGGTQSAE